MECPHLEKGIYEKPITNILLNSERLNTFLLKSGIKQGCSFTPFPLSTLLEVLAIIISQE